MIADDFWNECDRTGGPDVCWPWQRAITGQGYGTVWIPKTGKNIGAHRHAYQLAVGGIPRGKFVLHKCDNRRCVNPSHLMVGTCADNNADCSAKGRYRVRARLTPEEVRQIRKRIAIGVPVAEIVEQYNCCPSAVWNIKAGRAWASL